MPTVETFEAIPAGTYRAQIGDIEDVSTEYGDRWRWNFWPVLNDGTQERLSDLASQNFTPRSKAYKWTAAALNRKPEPGETVEWADLSGLWVQIVVSVNENGYNKVDMVLPDNQPAAATPPPQPQQPQGDPMATANVPPQSPQQPQQAQWTPPDERPF